MCGEHEWVLQACVASASVVLKEEQGSANKNSEKTTDKKQEIEHHIFACRLYYFFRVVADIHINPRKRF